MRDLLGKVVGEPVKTLIETITGGGAGRLHVPLAGADVVEAELVGDLRDGHGLRKILLVGKDEKDGVTKLILSQHLVKLVVSLSDTLAIVRVDHKDEALSVLEVVPPEGTDLVLTSDIPHGEVDVLVLDSLHIETDGRDCGHDLTKLKLIENGGLSSSIKTYHENPHILLAEKTAEKLCECRSHLTKTLDAIEEKTKKLKKKK